MMRKLLGITALLGALAAGLVPAAAAGASAPAPPDFLGANLQSLIRDGSIQPPAWAGFLRTAVQSGLNVARFDASWALAEPQPPGADGVHQYDWRWLDLVADALARRNQRWMPVVDLPPRWAQGPSNALPDSSIPAFVAFARAFAQRYGATGTFWNAHPELQRIPITQVEVWTEANSTHFWTGNPDPNHYLSVFGQVRAAMREVDPGMQMLVSLGWQDFENFMNNLYASGLAGQSDGIGFHPYAPTPAGVIKMTRTLRQLLVAHGEPDLPIYITEIGQPQSAPGAAPSATAYTGAVSDAARGASAAIAADALAYSDCNVKGYYWYSLVEPQRSTHNIEDWLGLINPNGTPTQTLQALSGSAQRWASPWGRILRGGRGRMLPLCFGSDGSEAVHSSTMPPNGKLPLQMHVPVPVTTPCMTTTVDYYGNPLEDVFVFVRGYKGRQAVKVTQAAGTSTICLGTGAPKRPFMIWARSGAFAASNVLTCTGSTCLPVSCRRLTLTARPGKVQGDVVPLKLSVKCRRRMMYGEPIRITGIGANGHVHHLRSLFSPPKTKVLMLRFKSKWDLRRIKIRLGRDRVFAFPVQVKKVRFPQAKKAAVDASRIH